MGDSNGFIHSKKRGDAGAAPPLWQGYITDVLQVTYRLDTGQDILRAEAFTPNSPCCSGCRGG